MDLYSIQNCQCAKKEKLKVMNESAGGNQGCVSIGRKGIRQEARAKSWLTLKPLGIVNTTSLECKLDAYFDISPYVLLVALFSQNRNPKLNHFV